MGFDTWMDGWMDGSIGRMNRDVQSHCSIQSIFNSFSLHVFGIRYSFEVQSIPTQR